MVAATSFSGLFLTFKVFNLRDRLQSYNISLEHLLSLRDAWLLKNVIRDTWFNLKIQRDAWFGTPLCHPHLPALAENASADATSLLCSYCLVSSRNALPVGREHVAWRDQKMAAKETRILLRDATLDATGVPGKSSGARFQLPELS